MLITDRYTEMGFNRPSLIQAQAIPYILSQ